MLQRRDARDIAPSRERRGRRFPGRLTLSLLGTGRLAGASEVLSEPLLDAANAARLLGIPQSSVYEYAKRGVLPHVKIGKHVKFIRSDLEQALIERRSGL